MSRPFESIVNRTKNQWNDKVHSRYAMAYNTAFQSFKETASKAEAEEKARAEFFATVVTIMSCSVGIAALGQSWLSRIVIRGGLSTLGTAPTQAAVRFVRHNQKNAVIGFVFGKATDALKDAGADQFKQIATSLFQRMAGGLTQTDPMNRHIELQSLLTAQADLLIDAYYSFQENRKLSGAQRSAAIAGLEQSPFMQPPGNVLNQEILAKKIELAFLMMKVLQGDHFVDTVEVMRPEPHLSSRRGAGIDIMPSDPKYPRGTVITQHFPLKSRSVEVDRPARAFRERTDELHKELYKSNFFDESWLNRRFGADGGAGSHALLLRAERRLSELSEQTRPKNAQFVAF